jgi:hypothetical protein
MKKISKAESKNKLKKSGSSKCISMVGATSWARPNDFRCKKNKVKATLGFLNKLKKFEIQVIKSGGFNKFN